MPLLTWNDRVPAKLSLAASAAVACAAVALLQRSRKGRPASALDVTQALLATLKTLFGGSAGSGGNSSAQGATAAEDAFYLHEYGGRDPMIGKFWFQGTTEAEFLRIVALLEQRLRSFLTVEYPGHPALEDASVPIVAELAGKMMPESELFCELIVLRHHTATRSATIVLNHAQVGGGDYLRLGTLLWNSSASDLITLPESKFVIAYCIARAMFDVLRALACGHGGQVLDGPIRRYCGQFDCLQLPGTTSTIGRRYIAARALCEEICRCTGWQSFHVIFPVGIDKEGAEGVANAVGAARIRYESGMTPQDLVDALRRKQYWVPATGFYSTRVKGSEPSSRASAMARSMADVVCTIAAFRRHDGPDPTRALTAATGTTYVMKFYPIYIWAMVEDTMCHWGVTVQTSKFQPRWSSHVGASADMYDV